MSALPLIDDLLDQQCDESSADSNKTIERIVILVAVDLECNPIVKALGLTEVEKGSKLAVEFKPMVLYTNQDKSIYAVWHGISQYKLPQSNNEASKETEIDQKSRQQFPLQRVGVQAACIAAWESIKQLSPDLILNIGTCGAMIQINQIDNTVPKPAVKQVFLGRTVYYHDRRIPLPPWSDGWDVGGYPCVVTPKLLSHLKDNCSNSIEYANISTGNAFDHTEVEVKLWRKHKTILKEMECASIAEICCEFGIPLIAIKGVTDIVDKDEAMLRDCKHKNQEEINKQFVMNLFATCEELAKAARAAVQFIHGKTIHQL